MRSKNNLINTVLIFGLCLTNIVLKAQTETFEGGSNLATTFTTNGKQFALSGLQISNVPTLGASSSNFFLETPFGTVSTGGTISRAGQTASFRVTSFAGWTSNDKGNSFKAGVNVQFTGNILGGGTVTQTFTINPTGNSGAQWHEGLTFNGTFQAANLTSLQVTILSTGVAGNYIALDNLVFSNITLPIELTTFATNTEGSKNNLTWATASEVNNKMFEIERSYDGKDFTSIGQVKGNNKPSNYQYVDYAPFNTTYYRLKQIDNDGTETYSKVITATLKSGKSLKVYPTLVSNGVLTVSSLRGDEATEGGDFAIYNVFGQQVQSGKTAQRLDVSTLAKGTYILKVGTELAKFVRQ